MKNTTAFIGKNKAIEITLPDTMVNELKDHYKYVPLRGYGYILAVKDNDKYIGFIGIEKLGYLTVKDYLLDKGITE